MSDSYVIAIDGGGTSTDFAWANLSGEIDYRLTIKKPSNPNYVGIDSCLNVLEEGITAGDKYFEKESVKFVYAGIAGCERSNDKTEKIEQHLRTLNCPVVVSGDLDSGYRSHTASPNGILLIAGTGDAIAVYRKGNPKKFQSGVAYGGREFGLTILSSVLNYPEKFSSTRDCLESNLGSFEEIAKLSPRDLVSNPIVNDFSAYLIEDEAASLELEQLLKFFGLRWALVASNFSAVAGLDVESEVPCVLSGSLWNWDVMRESFMSELPRYRMAEIIWEPSVKSIEGAAGIALELYQKAGN